MDDSKSSTFCDKGAGVGITSSEMKDFVIDISTTAIDLFTKMKDMASSGDVGSISTKLLTPDDMIDIMVALDRLFTELSK